MRKLLLLAFAAAGVLLAEVVVPRVKVAPVIDGTLGTGEWEGCKLGSPSVVVAKGAPKDPVAMYMGYDDSFVYAAVQFELNEGARLVTRGKDLFETPRVEVRLGSKEKVSVFCVNVFGQKYPAQGWDGASKNGVFEFRIPMEMLVGNRLYVGNIVACNGKEYSSLFPIDRLSFDEPKFHQAISLGTKEDIAAAMKAQADKSKSSAAQYAALAKECRKLGAFSLADASDGQRSVPLAWKPYVLEQSGKDFHFVFIPRMADFCMPNLPKTMPLFQDAAYQVHVWDLDRGMREPLHTLERLLDGSNPVASHILGNCSSPIYYCTEGGYATFENMLQISEGTRKQFISKYGKRLIAFDENESVGPSGGFPMIMGLAGLKPQNKKEAYEALKQAAFDTRRTFIRDWAVFYPEFAPFRSPVSCTFTDHLYLSMGFRMAGNECGPKTLCMPFSYAVSRGAARQYGRPFRSYLTTHEDKILFPGWEKSYRHYTMNDYRWALFPTTRKHYRTSGERLVYRLEGPEYGVQHLDWYRCFVYAYMVGTNTFFDESGHCIMYARYDYKTIDKEDPLLVNLRETTWHISKMGDMMAGFYDNIVRKEDRGAVYTPVAIMWDQYHGHFSNYHQMPWGLFDNTEGDLMMHAVMNSLFPEDAKKICYSRGFRTSVQGDVFDVITNASSQDTLNNYPAIFFCGDVPVDDAFAKKLVAYVAQGGKLAINYKQVEAVMDKFPRGFFGAEVTADRRKAKASYSRFSSRILEERIPFTYTVAKPAKGTEVPVFTADDAKHPLVLVSPYGKGRVILTMPDFLKERYSNTAMLAIFSDLMLQLGREALPVKIEGDVEFHVNRNKKGWLVALYNNYGVGFGATWQNPQQKPDATFDTRVTVTPKFKATSVREWFTGSRSLTVTVPAGEVRVIEIGN